MADIFDELEQKLLLPTKLRSKKDIFDALPRSFIPGSPVTDESVPSYKPEEAEGRGILSALTRGLKGGVSGILTGTEPDEAPPEQDFFERLAESSGGVVSDIPGFIGGGILGAPAGPIGAAAGAFAAPTLIREVAKEYRDFSKSKEPQTLDKFLERLQRVGTETGKSALIGVATGGAGKLLPFISKIPGVKKLLTSKFGQGAVKSALELGGLTTGQAVVEREVPTAEQVAQNALLLGGIKAASLGLSKTKALIANKKPIFDRVNKMLPEPVREKIKSVKKQSEYFDILKQHIGERDVKNVESQFKWRDELAKAEGKATGVKGKFTPKQREEMMYYRQKTGNPSIKGDTYDKLSKRIPNNAKKFVNETVDSHLRDSLKTWNENQLTQNINPRVGLEETYLPGLYEYDPKAFEKALSKLKIKNPFANQKIFLNYYEAFNKAGLKPKHKDIIGLMKDFDNIMNKTSANLKILDMVKEIESGKDKIIVRSNNPEEYRAAKEKGYIPFEDTLLKRYRDPGTGVWKTTEQPALVDKDFAAAFQGVFNKSRMQQPHWTGKACDKMANEIRFFRVRFSPFHYGALTESAVGSLGFKGLRFPTLAKEGKVLRNNKPFMIKAARAGLKVGHLENYKKGFTLLDKGIDALTDRVDSPVGKKAIGLLKGGSNYLFEEFHPNLKAVTFEDFSNNEITKFQKKFNRSPSVKEVNKINRTAATLVNDIYGGQNWETQRIFNDPKNMKWLRRTIGYPDWSTSTLRQAGSAFSTGLRGKLGRRYWLKYGIYMAAFHGLKKWFNSGFHNKEDGKPSWSLDKANKGITEGDPSKWYMFPLPDVNVTVAGKTLNPGRDKQDKKLYGHMGKQMLEIGKWTREPFNSFFGKSNPLISIAWKQILGSTPWGERTFTARGKWRYGKLEPWDATDPWTFDRASSRTKELLSDLMPFGLSNLVQKGVAPFVASGLGAVAISKGLNTFSAIPYIEKALKTKNKKLEDRIIKAMENNKISQRSIKSAFSRVRNQLKREDKL